MRLDQAARIIVNANHSIVSGVARVDEKLTAFLGGAVNAFEMIVK
jgi:hypothetical protein